MRAEMVGGEIVTLPKGCGCAIHHEPHWVHMWRLNRDMTLARIRPLLEKMDAIKAEAGVNSGMVSFSQLIDYEQAKLAVGAYAGDMARIYGDALADFKRRGIVRLIEDDDDRLTELETQRIRDRICAMYPVPQVPEISPYLGPQTEVRIKAREAL